MANEEPGIVLGADGVPRCWWGDSTAEYRAYHDREWGMPVADDVRLFEMLSLEGFQAGLSWLTILRKREAFRDAFAGFQPSQVARFESSDVSRLLGNAGIVRHRGKIEAVINNAGLAEELIAAEGSLVEYFWRFAPTGQAGVIDRAALAQRDGAPEAKALARELKRRGWRFIGPATVYAFMQAVGIVNDHLEGCAVRGEAELARARLAQRARGGRLDCAAMASFVSDGGRAGRRS